MRRYNAVLKHDLAGDGKVYKAGSVVGTVESTMPITNLVSAMFFGDVQLETDPSQAPPPEEIRHVRRDQVAAPSPEPQPVELDADALNALDADDEPTEPTEPTTPEETKPEIPVGLQALPPRIAAALAEHQFINSVQVQAYLDDGGLLADVPGIGKAAERKIMEWLQS